MKILSILKVVSTSQIDTNGLQSPYYNTPPLKRSQQLEEFDTQNNRKHKWYAVFKPPCMASGNMIVTMSLKRIEIRLIVGISLSARSPTS